MFNKIQKTGEKKNMYKEISYDRLIIQSEFFLENYHVIGIYILSKIHRLFQHVKVQMKGH